MSCNLLLLMRIAQNQKKLLFDRLGPLCGATIPSGIENECAPHDYFRLILQQLRLIDDFTEDFLQILTKILYKVAKSRILALIP